MKRATLLTGFNNWGKTTHIYNLFQRSKFYKGATYNINSVNASFTVESHSNDDFNEEGFIDAINDRIAQSPDKGANIFVAFCPTREEQNDSRRILSKKPFVSFDEIHILLLKYKWDFHAQLREKDIMAYLSSPSNIRWCTIDADEKHSTDELRLQAREAQIVSYLRTVYP